jgi:hypothetical protein
VNRDERSDQKKFARKFALLLSILAIITGTSVSLYRVDSYAYAARDKQARIRAMGEPQIIVVGDSNVALGVRARTIEEALGMPCTNYGLHAGLGQKFPAESIKGCIRPGDIVVLAPCEYEQDFLNLVLEWSATADLPAALTDFHHPRYWERLRAFPSYLQATLAALLEGRSFLPEGERAPGFTKVFSRRSFDAHGDMAFPRPATMLKEPLPRAALQTYPSAEMLEFWNGYAEFVHGRGATLLMSCPPILNHSIGIDLDEMQRMLEEGLAFPVISKFRDYLFPPEYFYDTVLHLTDEGAAARTDQLIADLRNYLEKESSDRAVSQKVSQ